MTQVTTDTEATTDKEVAVSETKPRNSSRTMRLIEFHLPKVQEVEKERKSIVTRLSITSYWIKAVVNKLVAFENREEMGLAPELEWVNHINDSHARIEIIQNPSAKSPFHIQLVVETLVKDSWSGRPKTKYKKYPIHDTFVEGNMWECCKLARFYTYTHKNRRAKALLDDKLCQLAAFQRSKEAAAKKAEQDYKKWVEKRGSGM